MPQTVDKYSLLSHLVRVTINMHTYIPISWMCGTGTFLYSFRVSALPWPLTIASSKPFLNVRTDSITASIRHSTTHKKVTPKLLRVTVFPSALGTSVSPKLTNSRL